MSEDEGELYQNVSKEMFQRGFTKAELKYYEQSTLLGAKVRWKESFKCIY